MHVGDPMFAKKVNERIISEHLELVACYGL